MDRRTLTKMASGFGLAFTVLTLAACSGAASPAPTASPTAASKSAGSAATRVLGSPTREIKVELRDNTFTPNEIRLKSGETVKIDAENKGTAIHNMIVEVKAVEGRDFMSSAMVEPGKDSEFVVSVSKPGTYRFYCSLHLPDMVGKLIVE